MRKEEKSKDKMEREKKKKKKKRREEKSREEKRGEEKTFSFLVYSSSLTFKSSLMSRLQHR